MTRTETAGRARPRREFPIAVHLTLFGVLTLIPVLLLVTWMLIDTARLRRDDSLHDAWITVDHLNATIEVEIQKAFAVAETLATSHALIDGDYDGFSSQARDAASRLDMVIVARDQSGQQLSSSAVPRGGTLPVSNADVLAVDRLAASRGEPVVSDLLIGTVTKVPLILADVPVYKGGDIVAFIDVVLRPQRLGEILSRDLPDGWIAGIDGRDGRLIARSLDQYRFIGEVNQQFLNQTNEPSGRFDSVSREGQRITGVYLHSPLSGWIVSVALPESMLNVPTKAAMTWLFFLVDATLATSVLLGWFLSRRIAAPIRALVARAREVGEGRLPEAGYSAVSEVNDVSEALAAASVELDRRAGATRQAADAAHASQERLQLVQETAGIATVDWDSGLDRAICSPRFYQMFALPTDHPVRFADVVARLHPADRARVEQSYATLIAQGGPFEHEFRIVTTAGEERWISVKGRLDARAGLPARLLAAGIDITERKNSEDHLRFLLREISHRSKNLLAVILAMAGQTAKSAESVDAFRRRFSERLMGIAASHDLLVNQNWTGASVENLVRGQLSPFVDARDPRVRLAGPDVDLKAEVAEALGIALHELATNSLKFGALKDPDGSIDIVWEVYDAGERGALRGVDDVDPAGGQRFRMEWIEHTPFPIEPPGHKGFGRMVIEHTVQATLSGTVTLDFPPEGLRWRIDAPATCLAPSLRGIAA
jgi:two-component sensor histidine kinase/PAS domain-containing protein